MSGAELSAQLARALTLSSFSRSGVAVTFGSSGAIGGAMVDQLAADGSFDNVMGFSRSSSPEIELLDEASLERAAASFRRRGNLRLIVDATGFLHDEREEPQKNWRDLDTSKLARAFALNAIGPALIMKSLLPLLPRMGRSVFATLSAQSRQHRRRSTRQLVWLPIVQGGFDPTGPDGSHRIASPMAGRCLRGAPPGNGRDATIVSLRQIWAEGQHAEIRGPPPTYGHRQLAFQR